MKPTDVLDEDTDPPKVNLDAEHAEIDFYETSRLKSILNLRTQYFAEKINFLKNGKKTNKDHFLKPYESEPAKDMLVYLNQPSTQQRPSFPQQHPSTQQQSSFPQHQPHIPQQQSSIQDQHDIQNLILQTKQKNDDIIDNLNKMTKELCNNTLSLLHIHSSFRLTRLSNIISDLQTSIETIYQKDIKQQVTNIDDALRKADLVQSQEENVFNEEGNLLNDIQSQELLANVMKQTEDIIANIILLKKSRQEEEVLLEAAMTKQCDHAHESIAVALQGVQQFIENRDAKQIDQIMHNIIRKDHRNKTAIDFAHDLNRKTVEEESHFSRSEVTKQIIHPLQMPHDEETPEEEISNEGIPNKELVAPMQVNVAKNNDAKVVPDSKVQQMLFHTNLKQLCSSLIMQLKGNLQIQQTQTYPDCFDDITKLLPEEISSWTQMQKNVLILRLEGKTIREIKSTCNISSDDVVLKIIRRTLTGNSWSVFTNGRYPCIGQVQENYVLNLIQERADELNAIEEGELISILEEINARYLHRGYMFALLINNPIIAQELLETRPTYSYSWLNNWAKNHMLELKTPQKLEHLRRKYCHKNVLVKFYNFLLETIKGIDPELLFNADETALSFNNRGKVVVPNGAFPTKGDDRIKGHYTAMLCFNAVGQTLEPFIILPNCKTLPPELTHFIGQADFATGPNGWMTSKLFLEWAIIFCRKIRLYRLRLSNEMKNKPCFLFLDGHRSRLNSEACELFNKNNIRVIVLPAHTSHCTQPFDVGVAASFKSNFKNLFNSLPKKLIDENFKGRKQKITAAAQERFKIIYAVIDAWKKSTTKRNCESAFKAASIYPIDPINTVLRRTDVRDSTQYDEDPPTKGIDINGKEITTPLKRIELAEKYFGIKINDVNQIPKVDETEIIKRQSLFTTEKLLNDFPISVIEVAGEAENGSRTIVIVK